MTVFGNLDFVLVSDFDIRIPNLTRVCFDGLRGRRPWADWFE